MVNQPGDAFAVSLAWGLRQAHQRLEDLVSDLTDDQLTWRPMPASHSLAFALWHIPRCDDNYLRAHIQGRAEIWQEERWYEQWGLDRESTGMSLDDEVAAQLPLPARETILAYARRVWSEVASFVEGLSPEELARPVDQVERTSGLSTAQLITTHIYGHDNRHLGEMEYLKGLLGLRGSVTL